MKIPYGKQQVTEADIQAVVDVLRSDFLTQGPAVEAFEKEVAAYCGVRYAVAVNSATSALHLACLAADLGAGDILWTSPNTFVASANCGLYCGANVDFVDIDSRTLNLSPGELAGKLEQARRNDCLPKVVIPVHFAGQSCEMDKIHELAKQYGFSVIEDASHAIGGQCNGAAVGSCRFSDMTVFSFHPVKMMTTGEGGMVLTNRQDLYQKVLRLRTHGITRDETQMVGEPHGPWYYQQLELGCNYRMTDMQAALGLSQLKRLDTFVARRNHLAARYRHAFRGTSLACQYLPAGIDSAFHLFVVRLPKEKGGDSRRGV
ncbi:MAG: UDP-4-amino-4,6-dideoxy-N-acetyl-beta-L-altrosamine transaminase [Syntrophotaleaceae bacterium]